MGEVTIDQILVTPLKRIQVAGGDVLHAIKRTDNGFRDFGEAYFSMVDSGVIKAWKMHKRMTLNLVVPIGDVKFVFVDKGDDIRRQEIIGESNYARLTVPPGIWFGFQGLTEPFSMIMNLADIPHDPDEVLRKEVEEIEYDWSLGK